jgi:hypothetical protein
MGSGTIDYRPGTIDCREHREKEERVQGFKDLRIQVFVYNRFSALPMGKRQMKVLYNSRQVFVFWFLVRG